LTVLKAWKVLELSITVLQKVSANGQQKTCSWNPFDSLCLVWSRYKTL